MSYVLINKRIYIYIGKAKQKLGHLFRQKPKVNRLE